MGTNYTKTSVGSGFNSDAIETNFDDIKTALDDTLSRSGVATNSMAADLDMNSNRILNLIDATNNSEPATYRQLISRAVSELDGAANIVTDITTMIAIDTSTLNNNDIIYVLGFYSDTKEGGGFFYWDSDQSKANHDGGLIIDPDHTQTPGDPTSTWWTNENAGTGCFMRVTDSHVIYPEWWGAKGDNSNNDGPAILEAQRHAATQWDNDVNGAVVEFRSAQYVCNQSIPISRGIVWKSGGYRQSQINATHNGAMLYSATFSAGTFTDNQDGTLNEGGKMCEEIGLFNIFFNYTGDLSSTSPDTTTSYLGVVSLVNCVESRFKDIRIDVNGGNSNINFWGQKNSYFSRLENIKSTCGTAASGGYAFNFIGANNNMLLDRCGVFGGFERGYSFDAGSSGLASVTLIECDAEGVDYKDDDEPSDNGTGIGCWIGGSDSSVRCRSINVLGGYWENNNVDFQVGSSTTGSKVVNFKADGTYHGDNATSVNAFKFINSHGHKVLNPVMSRWDFKYLTLSSNTGTPVAGEKVTIKDRFGNNLSAWVVAWDGVDELTVRQLDGDPDPTASVTTASMTAGTLGSIDTVSYYGSSGNTHFDVDTGGQVTAGYFELTWSDSQNFKPQDVGLNAGDGTIKINGTDGSSRTYRCTKFWEDNQTAQVPRYRSSTLDQSTVTSAVNIYKIVVPAENYGVMARLELDFYHQSELTADPASHHDMSHVKLCITIVRSRQNADATVDFNLTQAATDATETGTSATVPSIVVGDFSASGNTGSGELEIDIDFTASAADASTDNTLTCQGSISRFGNVRVYSAEAA